MKPFADPRAIGPSRDSWGQAQVELAEVNASAFHHWELRQILSTKEGRYACGSPCADNELAPASQAIARTRKQTFSYFSRQFDSFQVSALIAAALSWWAHGRKTVLAIARAHQFARDGFLPLLVC